MNLLKIAFCSILAIGFIACDKDDDDNKCSQSDWTGTYVGTIECDGLEEDVTVTITADGSEAIVISYETDFLTVEYDPLTPNQCDLNISDSGGGISLTIDAELDGDKLSLIEIYTAAGSTSNCEITAEK